MIKKITFTFWLVRLGMALGEKGGHSFFFLTFLFVHDTDSFSTSLCQRTGGSLPKQPSEVPYQQGRMPCECYLQGILSRLPNFSGYLSGKLFCYITIQ